MNRKFEFTNEQVTIIWNAMIDRLSWEYEALDHLKSKYKDDLAFSRKEPRTIKEGNLCLDRCFDIQKQLISSMKPSRWKTKAEKDLEEDLKNHEKWKIAVEDYYDSERKQGNGRNLVLGHEAQNRQGN